MLDRLSIYRYTSVRTMLDLLGLDYKEYVLALGRYGLDLDDSFLKKDFLENKDLSSFLKELLPDIIENSEEEFLSLQYYIDRLNLSGKVGDYRYRLAGTFTEGFGGNVAGTRKEYGNYGILSRYHVG